MTMRQTQKYEIPEKKNQTQYDPAWINSKVDILLGLVASRMSQMGIYLAGLLNKNQDILKQIVTKYFTDMHAYCFSQIKSVVRNTQTPDKPDFSRETIRKIVVDLEKEFGAALPELGIESDPTIDAFVLNQCRWFSQNFKFKENA